MDGSVCLTHKLWIMFGVNPILIVVLGMKYVQDLDILSNVCISDGVDICVMDIRTLIAVQQVSRQHHQKSRVSMMFLTIYVYSLEMYFQKMFMTICCEISGG